MSVKREPQTHTRIFGSLAWLAGIMLILDAIYLYSTKSLSIPVYQSIQGSPIKIHYGGAFACYVLMTLGLYYFIIRDHRSVLDAFLLGTFVYGVYDMTTLAIFSKYTLGLAIMDMIWGGILFGTTTWIYRNIQ
jgi:uncharacterized membrane protein